MVKRKMAALTLFLLLLLLALPVVSVAAEPVNADDYVIDEHGLLDERTKEQIASSLAEASASCGCPMVFLLYDYSRQGGYMTEADLHRYPQIDRPQDVMVLEVTREPHEITFLVHMFGKTSRISANEMDYIADRITKNIKAGNYTAAAAEFSTLSARAYSGRLCPWWRVFLIAGLIALAVSGIVTGIIYYTYKRKLKSEIYPLDRYAQLNLTDHSEVLTGRFVATRRISNSSGGSSGSSRSGGGRSGGGGHTSSGRR